MEVILNSVYKGASKTKLRYRIIYGGAGSGKSHFIAQETLLNMLSDGKYSYLVVRKTAKSIKNSVFKSLVSKIHQYGLGDYFKVNKTDMSVECVNGSLLVTSGLDDVEKLKSIDGINRIWVEEASEITESDFDQLDLRMRGLNTVGYQMTFTFNPISELHWLKKRFFDLGGPDVFVLKTTYKDNKYLDEAYVKKLENLINNDFQFYRIYVLGEWGSIGNLVFTKWKKANLNELIDIGDKQVPLKSTFDNYYNGLDFGFASDPLAFIRLHYDVKNKRIYVTDEIMQTEMFNDEASEVIKPIINNEILSCDTEPKSVADLRRNGLNAKSAKKGAGSIEHGIKFIQQCEIIVDVGCVNTIRELSGYKWREDKDGNIIPKPVEYDNHLIDAMRYALEPASSATQWGWK